MDANIKMEKTSHELSRSLLLATLVKIDIGVSSGPAADEDIDSD